MPFIAAAGAPLFQNAIIRFGVFSPTGGIGCHQVPAPVAEHPPCFTQVPPNNAQAQRKGNPKLASKHGFTLLLFELTVCR